MSNCSLICNHSKCLTCIKLIFDNTVLHADYLFTILEMNFFSTLLCDETSFMLCDYH